MPSRGRRELDRFTALAVSVGAVTGALARMAVVNYFWWSAADPDRMDAMPAAAFDISVVLGTLISLGLGGLTGGFFGMVAGFATDNRILKVTYPALATFSAAVVTIGTALGTIFCLCGATYSHSAGGRIPRGDEYLIWMGVAGAAPVLLASLVATIARRCAFGPD
jgi:hypothetical protein